MNTVTTSGNEKTITVSLTHSELKDRIQRDSAWMARSVAENTDTLERLTLTDNEGAFIASAIKDALRAMQVSLTPYCTSYSETDPYTIKLTIAATFDSMLSHSIEVSLTEMICKSVLAQWYSDNAQINIAKELIQECENKKALVNAILYNWRINRSVAAFPTTSSTSGTSSNELTITITLSDICSAINTEINSSLKSKYGTTLEYKNKEIGTNEATIILRECKSAATKVAETAGAYVKTLTKTDTTISLVLEVSKNARQVLSSSLSDRMCDALLGYAASRYLNNISEEKLAATYWVKWEESLKQLEEELYKWRVEIQNYASPSYVLTTETTQNIYNVVIPDESVLVKIKQEVNTRLKAICKNTEEYKSLEIGSNQLSIIASSIDIGYIKIAEAISAYVSTVSALNGNRNYSFILAKTSRKIIGEILCSKIYDALVSYSAIQYLTLISQNDLIAIYSKKYAEAISELQEELYKWRVDRQTPANSFVHTYQTEDNNILFVAIPTDKILRQSVMDVNAAFKVMLPTTEEYEKFKAGESEASIFSTRLHERIHQVANTMKAYLIAYSVSSSAAEVIENILSQTGETVELSEAEYIYFALMMPLNYDPASVNVLESTLSRSLTTHLSMKHAIEVNAMSVVEKLMMEEMESTGNIMPILHRRSPTPIRRMMNHFN